MKRILNFMLLLWIVSCLVACKRQVKFTEKNIKDSYSWNDCEIVQIDVSYPEFDPNKYEILNEAILSEFINVKDDYDALCKERQLLCENDPISAKLQCYITATYDIKVKGNIICVTVVRDCFGGGASCHGYKKNIEYNTKTNELSEIRSDVH